MNGLTPEMMWQAVKTNNSAYDGSFFYGVKSTRIFCKPSCKSKLPARENVRFFLKPDKAIQEGYRPCKRCRPELSETAYNPMQELVVRATELLKLQYPDPKILSKLPMQIGISPFYLQRCFKRQTGLTPRLYLQKIRIQKSMELLTDLNINNTEICFEVGFLSLSNFYAAFRSETGISPGAYRKKNRKILPESDHHESCI